MNAVDFENLVEESMQRLFAGAGLEDILADFPDQAEEMRPILLAALDLRQMASEIQPTPVAQTRSRVKFLTAAAGIAAPAPKRGFRFNIHHLRLAASSAILIGIFAAVLLLGTGFASADALPGDVFYPVKIMVEQMQIDLVQDSPARLEMENVYDDRRQAEVVRLTKMQRREQVTFSGFLKNAGVGKWKIGSVSLVFSPGDVDPADYEDSYVEITGKSNSEVVEVESIKLRRLQWEGVLQKFDDQSWQINGLSILLNNDTEISGQPQIGATVRVVAVRPSGDRYSALSLSVNALTSKAVKIVIKPSSRPSQENSETHESGEFKKTNSQPGMASSTPEPQSQPTPTWNGEEGNKTKSRPSPTPTKKSDEEHNATRTPTRVPDPTRTPTRVPDPTRTPSHND